MTMFGMSGLLAILIRLMNCYSSAKSFDGTVAVEARCGVCWNRLMRSTNSICIGWPTEHWSCFKVSPEFSDSYRCVMVVEITNIRD